MKRPKKLAHPLVGMIVSGYIADAHRTALVTEMKRKVGRTEAVVRLYSPASGDYTGRRVTTQLRDSWTVLLPKPDEVFVDLPSFLEHRQAMEKKA